MRPKIFLRNSNQQREVKQDWTLRSALMVNAAGLVKTAVALS